VVSESVGLILLCYQKVQFWLLNVQR
jgi:hypothetical protein